MDQFVGLDVSLRPVAICVINVDGRTVLERSVACEIIIGCQAGLATRDLRIGFEAGAMSQHLLFGLQAAGLNVVCMEARQVNAGLSTTRNQTDKTDARGTAYVLRSGWFNPVNMKNWEAHAVLALLSSRKTVQRKCIDLANEIRGLVRIFGLRLPPRIDQATFDEKVRPIIEVDPDLSHALLPLLDARAVLFSTYRELDRHVKRVASYDETCLRIMAIPGVGPIAAAEGLASSGNPQRQISKSVPIVDRSRCGCHLLVQKLNESGTNAHTTETLVVSRVVMRRE